jgi:hypothetical protein
LVDGDTTGLHIIAVPTDPLAARSLETPMRKREFRPTLDGRLEDRVVPTGHPAVTFTTNGYYNALNDIDGAVGSLEASPMDLGSTTAFLRALKNASKTIPYGGKLLYPALQQTAISFAHAGQLDQSKAALNEVVRQYILKNIQNGSIRYLQSNDHNFTDGDIPTSGDVPKGSKK